MPCCCERLLHGWLILLKTVRTFNSTDSTPYRCPAGHRASVPCSGWKWQTEDCCLKMPHVYPLPPMSLHMSIIYSNIHVSMAMVCYYQTISFLFLENLTVLNNSSHQIITMHHCLLYRATRVTIQQEKRDCLFSNRTHHLEQTVFVVRLMS